MQPALSQANSTNDRVRWEQNHYNIQISHPSHYIAVPALRPPTAANNAKHSTYNPDLVRAGPNHEPHYSLTQHDLPKAGTSEITWNRNKNLPQGGRILGRGTRAMDGFGWLVDCKALTSWTRPNRFVNLEIINTLPSPGSDTDSQLVSCLTRTVS